MNDRTSPNRDPTRMPSVSVIIPVFNSASLISKALRSVFAQTFQDFEVIVVDDGSEDSQELEATLAEWTARIVYLRQPNGGPAKARNTGIARATGELIAFLDADDEWLPEKLARQVEYFRRYPETGLLHTGMVGEASPSLAQPGPPRAAFCDLYHTVFFINTLTVVVPGHVLKAVGSFDERREIHTEDWDLWLRIAAKYPVGYLPEPLAFYRPGGLMSRQVDRTYAAQALIIEKQQALCRDACATHRAAPARCERRRRHVLHRDWGYDRLAAGERHGAREQLRKAVACRPSDLHTWMLYASTFVSDRWRRRVRALTGESATDGKMSRHPDPNAAPLTRAKPFPSLVHDTVYRRLRRRVSSRLHDFDDVITRIGRSRKSILFEATSPMNFAIFRPIYERLQRDPRVELWFTVCGGVWTPQDVFGPAGITRNVVPTSAARWMKVDAYVNTDFWAMTWLPRRTRRIHLFHGVAGKYGLDAPVEFAPTIAAFDCLMFANEDRRRKYVQAGLVADDDMAAALVGYPKADCLVDGSLDRTTIARKLGLDTTVPIVIYAPTWSPHSSLNAMGEEVVDRLAAEGLQVIVKLHDRSYDLRQRASGGIDWAVRLSRYDSHPRVRVVREADGAPFLVLADAMVSDHSSIAFEYMLLDRPIVVIDCPELIEQARVSRDKIHSLRSAADVAVDAADTTRAVMNGLRDPARRSLERRRIAADLFYRPGTATDRALALIYAIVGLPLMVDAPRPAESGRAVAAVG